MNNMEMLRLFEESIMVKGTNCVNCKFGNIDDMKPISEDDKVDDQGGLIPSGKNLILAKEGDLVTLPGNMKATKKFGCGHPKIKQDVTAHMCCAFWDADGVLRHGGSKDKRYE